MAVFVFISPLAHGADDQRIVVEIRTSTEVDGRRSSRNTKLITTVNKTQPGRVELSEGYLMVSVADERDGEFSIRLDFYGVDESVIDSSSILTSQKAAEFRFSSYRATVIGTVSIEFLE